MVAVVGDVYRFLATGDDTDGKYAMFEATLFPGGGPPPHVHSREEEAFYLLDGEVAFMIDGKSMVLKPGMSANIPRGVLHAFKNETDKPAKMLITVAPAGLEKMFLAVGVPIAPNETPAPVPPTIEDIEKLLSMAAQFGIEIRMVPH
jgi:quercetin dioxygenase-like cupin family protein